MTKSDSIVPFPSRFTMSWIGNTEKVNDPRLDWSGPLFLSSKPFYISTIFREGKPDDRTARESHPYPVLSQHGE
jgi:hypothetical protein